MKSVTVLVRKKHWQAAMGKLKLVGEEVQIKTTQCPIAQALRDKFEGYFASVYPDRVYLGTRSNNSPKYTLDAAGLALIETFEAQEWEEEDFDWTKKKPQGTPSFYDGKKMPKFPVKVTLKPCI